MLSFSDEQRFRAGNIRGNDYLMTFEELGSGFALIPPIPYQPVLLMRDNAGEILKVPVNDFEAYVRWGSPPERCLTTLVVDAWGNYTSPVQSIDLALTLVWPRACQYLSP